MGWRGRGAVSRKGSACARCGSGGSGGGRRKNAAAVICASCLLQVCERHSVWDNDGYICTVCARLAGIDPKGR